MADPNPLAAMPLAESLANNMNESLQWMSRMWGSSAGVAPPGAESLFGAQLPPGLPSMLMPTLDPKELEKRINDLKTVEHWLDMNRALLHSTIQTLEMQRNAIVALQAMAQSAQSGSATAFGGIGAPATSEAAGPERGEAAPAVPPLPFNPALWWNSLQEQFARVASAAAAATEAQRPTDPPQSQAEPPGGEHPST
ncbi:MAG TPA: PhaM family polyhydroxyalkanoate granule multifunctional regulatory protein [Burkholderiaceae bacterium]|nr:PhaM family polyhydroxyalkanoate granule multifunctional regulatory protein [Burkholderiaceae bacterium]